MPPMHKVTVGQPKDTRGERLRKSVCMEMSIGSPKLRSPSVAGGIVS
jgi:hypothetical protein